MKKTMIECSQRFSRFTLNSNLRFVRGKCLIELKIPPVFAKSIQLAISFSLSLCYVGNFTFHQF